MTNTSFVVQKIEPKTDKYWLIDWTRLRLMLWSPTEKSCWLALFLSAQDWALRSTYTSWRPSWSHGFKKWVGRELSAAAGRCPLLKVQAHPEVVVQQKDQILAWGNQAAQQPRSPPFWLFCVGYVAWNACRHLHTHIFFLQVPVRPSLRTMLPAGWSCRYARSFGPPKASGGQQI